MKKIGILILIFLSACCGSKKTVSSKFKAIPQCIALKIEIFKIQPVQYPPGSIYSYTYNNKIVYYVPPVCCDQFSDLYDGNCELLGHPDGGFNGKGDGLFIDFSSTRSDEKLIWMDDRGK